MREIPDPRSLFRSVWHVLCGTFLPCLLAVVLTGTTPPAQALDAEEMFEDPAQEARARDIGRQLRCLVCQNESIFDSNAGLARDLRVVVRERMAEGDSDAEVIAFVSDRYGDYVLLKPPVEGHTLVLWLAPVLFLGIGGIGLLTYHRSRERRVVPELSAADRAEAQHLLNGEQ
ncbi:cytochrome c-type biogenesis protein [Tropicimonas marinistellae]|uniref:cytochrome c-type biogenesis protein n=1 Tax=Tropicimonas marinistellae TaxID=1739787 RepID=UPI00098FFA7F|nr:cytochrome c-type biogenesis protein [Tropicimonas marinistellae]